MKSLSEMSNQKSYTGMLTRLDWYLYAVYLFCMPFQRLIILPEGVPTTIRIMHFSTWIMLVGVVLLVRRTRFNIPERLHPWIWMYVFMALYSVVAAVIISQCIPQFHGLQTYLAPAENIVNYLVTLLSIYYNFTCLSSVRSFRSLGKVFDASLVVVIFIGYLQFGILHGVPGCNAIYDVLREFLALYNPETLVNSERGVVLFGSEPAAVSGMFYILVPYLVVSILFKWPGRIKHIIMLSLLVVLFCGSGSSSVIIMLCMAAICTVSMTLYRPLLRYIAIGAFVCGAAVAIMYATAEFSSSKVDRDSFEYKLYGKVVDKHNYSTMMRSSTIAVNMKILKEYPYTGVGMGLQGLWYPEYVPTWTKRSFEVQALLSQSGGISNGGGAFFPMYLSAFGLIGIVVMLYFLAKYIPYIKRLRHNQALYCFYMMGISSALLAMWYTGGPKLNETLCFMLVFPLCFYSRREVVGSGL